MTQVLPSDYAAASDRPDSKQESSNGHAAAAMRLRHLPPISLQMCIPPGYPQEEPPQCQLFSEWLSPQQIGALHKQLEDLWQQQGPGLPIGFLWIDWLQNEALSFLGLQDGIFLKPQGPPVYSEHVSGSISRAGQSTSSHVDGDSASNKRMVSADVQSGQCSTSQDSKVADGHLTASGSNGHLLTTLDGPNGAPNNSAQAAYFAPSPEAVFARLIAYDAMREVEIFKAVCHQCCLLTPCLLEPVNSKQ